MDEEYCLQLRNRNGRSEETYCKHYRKKFRGYIRHVFINYRSVGIIILLLFVAVLTIACGKLWQDNDMPIVILLIIGGLALLFEIYSLLKALWCWKYAKHVVVTNEGIWIMHCSALWRNKDFTGKKRFLSPSWSLYSWGETKISADASTRPRSGIKLANFFDDFDYAVIRSTHLATVFLTRSDGVEQIHFLDESDADEILSYARAQRRGRKRKKKDTEIIEDDYDKIPDERPHDCD